MPLLKSGNLRIDNVRLVFPAIFEPKAGKNNDGDPKYSVGVLIPRDHPDVPLIIEQMKEAAKKKFNDKAAERYKAFKAKDNLALHDGDTKDLDKYPEYRGMYYMNAYNKAQPTIKYKGDLIEKDNGQFYSGCYGNVIVNFWAQDDENRKGINAGLAGVQWKSEGERLAGGKVASADEFEALDDDDEVVDEARIADDDEVF